MIQDPILQGLFGVQKSDPIFNPFMLGPALSPRDRDFVTRTLIGEAGIDPASQSPIAGVIKNRADKSNRTPSEVVLAPHQFEAWQADPMGLLAIDPESQQYKDAAKKVDDEFFNAGNSAGDATLYYAPRAQAALGRRTPKWASTGGEDIGLHTFFPGQFPTPPKLGDGGLPLEEVPPQVSGPTPAPEGGHSYASAAKAAWDNVVAPALEHAPMAKTFLGVPAVLAKDLFVDPVARSLDNFSAALGGKMFSADEAPAVGMDAAAALIGPGAVFGKPEGSVGIFGGKLAKGADLLALQQAKRLAEAGATPDEILGQTGWHQGADKQWKFEISDHLAGITPRGEALQPGDNPITMYDYLHHPELFGAYPGRADIPVKAMEGEGALYHPGSKPSIEMGSSFFSNRRQKTSDPLSMTLHELQHAVQQGEGFASGAGPDNVTDKVTRAFEARRTQLMSKPVNEWTPEDAHDYPIVEKYLTTPPEEIPASSKYPLLDKIDPTLAYTHTAGEVEARNVEERKDYGWFDRQIIPPWDTQDTPYSQQLTFFNPQKPDWAKGNKIEASVIPGLGGHGQDPYETPLTPEQETQFQVWKQKYAPKDSGEDYDLRGAFLAGLTPDPKTHHWPDTFKKPNHPTFSDQSKYAKFGKPGHWEGDKYVPYGQ